MLEVLYDMLGDLYSSINCHVLNDALILGTWNLKGGLGHLHSMSTTP
jgi:hypothetical protein